MPLLATAGSAGAELAGRAGRALGDFARLIAGLRATAEVPPAARRARAAIIDGSGLREALRREGTAEAESRLENLDELVVAAEEFAARPEGGDLAGFLDSVSLISDVDELQEARPAATLMTLHSAKGLEFPAVFLTGLEEGVFPHGRALDDEEGIEEERRLAYVGLTRAKERLFLSYAAERRLGGYAGSGSRRASSSRCRRTRSCPSGAGAPRRPEAGRPRGPAACRSPVRSRTPIPPTSFRSGWGAVCATPAGATGSSPASRRTARTSS